MTQLNAVVGSFVRTGLATLGGILVAKGVISPDAADSIASGGTELVLGGLSWGIAQLWSLKLKLPKF